MGYVSTSGGLAAVTIPVWPSPAVAATTKPTLAVTQSVYRYPASNGATLSLKQNLATGLRTTTPKFSSVASRALSPLARKKAAEPKISPRPPVTSLRTMAVSQPIARHGDQNVRPPIQPAVMPAYVNQPTLQTVVDRAPGPTPAIMPKYVAPAELRTSVPTPPTVIAGTDPTATRYQADYSAGSTGLTLAEPPAPANVQPSPDGLKFSDLVQVEPIKVQTAEEAAGQTFLSAAGFPPWAVVGVVAAGLWLFFSSAKKTGRRARRRRPHRRS